MSTTNLNNKKISIPASLIIIFSILLSLIIPALVSAAGSPPDITVKLNGSEVAYNHDIAVENRDKLEIIADFKTMNAGDTYEVDLPAVFITLNEETIKEANKDILQYVNLTITKDENGRQKVKITFLEKVDAASFSFWAILDISEENLDEKQEIIIDGDLTISILPTEPPNPPGEYEGPYTPPTGVPDDEADLEKSVINNIPEKMFLEDTNIHNSLHYNLGLNLAQLNRTLTGTMKDTLPTGMKLFIPSAPGCGESSYESAFASFSIFFMTTLIEGDSDDNCYVNISNYYGAAAKYVEYVNAIEISQGRTGSYTTSNLSPTIKIPSYLAASIKNADGKYVTYDGAVIGYRIDQAGTIHLTTLDNEHTDLFEKKHIGAWTDSSLYIPLYNTPDCETSIHTIYDFQKYTVLQECGELDASANREYLGSSVNETITSYRWSYTYQGKEELILVVKNDSATDADSFEIEMKGSADSYSYGRALCVQPRIYFDQSKWEVPLTGVITFKNTVTYEYWERSTDTKYVYDFGSSGTVVAGAGKTVDDEKTNRLDPDTGETIQKYALTFKKLGNEKIPAGNFEVFDQLDKNLIFVNNSLKIYKEDGGWIDITDPAKNADTSAATIADDGVNLKAYYDSDTHRIVIVNVASMSFTGRIKVEFQTDLAEDVEYGTKISNYFGETTESYVSHKLAIKKTDTGGNAVISSPAEFSVQYATESNFETSQLHDLTDSEGNKTGGISTNDKGIASAIYAIDADVFYLKITETAPPDGYVKLAEPIWIKAERDTVTQKMTYTLAKEIDGIEITAGEKGLITFAVENEKLPEAKPEPTEIVLEATKTAHGKALEDNQFGFAVYENETKVAEGTNTADGKITFSPISYTAPGSHVYQIRELSTNIQNWTTDDREYTVTVEVTEQDGILKAAAVYTKKDIIFLNKFIEKSDLPNTSDNSNVLIGTLIIILSFGIACFLATRKDKKSDK
jgi:streptococcal pilin isopeptide linkage domain